MDVNLMKQWTRWYRKLGGITLAATVWLGSCVVHPYTSKGQAPVRVFKAMATTGEGSIWHPERKSLFWVDIECKTLYEFLPRKKDCRKWRFDRMITTVVPETDSTVVIALQNEIVRVNVNSDERIHIADIDDLSGSVRCNDGKCDPEGRLWIGTMSLTAPHGAACLYCVTPGGQVSVKVNHVTISNGLVWTADKKYMYYIDTPTQKIVRYKYQRETGNIEYDKVVVTVPAEYGAPDGMTIDYKGNLWVAHWGGYGVYCWDPQTGKLVEKVNVPAPNVASCAFGGKDLTELYITTARAGLSPELLEKYPDSGSLFVYKSSTKGVKANCFGKK